MPKSILYLIFLCCFFETQSQEKPQFCEQLQALKILVQNDHFRPKPVNDSLSSGVFDTFLSFIDNDKRLFTEENMNTLETDRFQLDNYILDNDCSFIEKYSTILNERIENTKQILNELLTLNLDYSGKDTLRFKPNSEFEYFKNEARVKRYWSKRIRYDILFALIENDSVYNNISENFKSLESEIKPKIIQKELCQLEELQNRNGDLSQFVKEAFLNAYVAYHDPNSSFFNASDKTVFENSLSNDQLSFGIITAKNDDGDIIIAHVTPGSAAFIDGSFEVNDIVKSIQANGITLETYCVSNDDILAFTSDDKNQTITFKIKKQDGDVITVELTKTITKIEDNSVTGFVLQDALNIGYINIPSFYTDLESPNGFGLANDVAKELLKLKKESISGLIIDLRFNGGGSMKEAADLSGMFINRGPLSILKYSNGDMYTIRDMNRGSLFTKPIVVLINNFSASASEFFAAAMQDYNRAVIIGSPSHGKASAQVILPLDEDGSLGFSKLTVEKFYRISGKSHQSIGVIPDIVLPDLYDNFKTEERFSPFALNNDSIKPKVNYLKLAALPIKQLQSKSKSRVEKSKQFDAVKALNQLVIDNYFELETEYLLTLENVHHEMDLYHSNWKNYNELKDNNTSQLTIKNTKSTEGVIEYDSDKKEMNAAVLDDIKHDIYITEAYTILLDLLRLNPLN